jgi:hypothetical protein
MRMKALAAAGENHNFLFHPLYLNSHIFTWRIGLRRQLVKIYPHLGQILQAVTGTYQHTKDLESTNLKYGTTATGLRSDLLRRRPPTVSTEQLICQLLINRYSIKIYYLFSRHHALVHLHRMLPLTIRQLLFNQPHHKILSCHSRQLREVLESVLMMEDTTPIQSIKKSDRSDSFV